MTQSVKTLTKAGYLEHPEAEEHIFKSGEIRYLLRSFQPTEPKLIFMRML